MVQYQKDEVRQRICDAAVEEMAKLGYKKATMGGIARKANVATGNIYRYFRDKEELFVAILPDAFLRDLFRLMKRKVGMLEGVDDIRSLSPDSEYHLVSSELLDFCINNRLRVVILLIGTEGSPQEGFSEKVVRQLRTLAIDHFRSIIPGFSPTKIERFELELAYRNFIRAISEMFLQFNREKDIREAVTVYMKYHLAGLSAMFDGS